MAVDHILPFFALVAALGVTCSVSWHLRTRYWTIIMMALWLFIWNLVIFINAMVWWNNVENHAPIWCDISVKLTSMWQMGVPCASFCISKRLEAIASTRVVSNTPKEKRRTLIFDLFMTIGLPILYAVLSIVYQGHRFNIVGGAGCFPAIFVSWPYVVLGLVPPMLVSLISVGYSILCLRHFVVRQKQFTAVLSSSGSNLNRSRYLRIMALSASEMFVTIPLWVVVQILSSDQYTSGWNVYTSWSDVHYGFGSITKVPSEAFNYPEFRRSFATLEISRWSAVLCGFLFVFFFGFTSEAIKEYRLWFKSLKEAKQSLQGVKIWKKQARAEQNETAMTTRRPELAVLEIPPLTPKTEDDIIQYKEGLKTPLPSPYYYSNDVQYEDGQSHRTGDSDDVEVGRYEGISVHVEKTIY